MYNEKGKSGNGITSNNYDDNKIIVNMRQRYSKSLAIKNTSSVNSLMLVVYGYFTKNELIQDVVQKETTVAPGVAKTVLFDGIAFDHFTACLKSAVEGEHASYVYEYLITN